jgi:hypothetical protein
MKHLISSILSLSKRLVKEPGFAFWGALALALGIGANAVIYCSSVAVFRRELGHRIESRIESRVESPVENSIAGPAEGTFLRSPGDCGGDWAWSNGYGARRAKLKLSSGLRCFLTSRLGQVIMPLFSR